MHIHVTYRAKHLKIFSSCNVPVETVLNLVFSNGTRLLQCAVMNISLSSNYLPKYFHVFFFPAASNILICRSGSCHCADIFCCECPVESKCEIRISDFDSVKLFSRGLSATSVPDVACKAKADTTKVLGTPYYRAPEVIKLYLVYTRTYMYTLTHVHVHALYVYNHVHVCTHNSYLPVIGVHFVGS